MKRFSIVERGYDINEVNRFIDIVIGRLEKLNAENASYISKIDELNDKIQNTKSTNVDTERLEKALLAIQNISDNIEKNARNEADMIIEEAKNNANSIVHEALISAEKTEQKKLMLEKNIKIYKEKVRSLTQAQLSLIEDLDKEKL